MNRFAITRSLKRRLAARPGSGAVERRLHRRRRNLVRVDDECLDQQHGGNRDRDRQSPVDDRAPRPGKPSREPVDRALSAEAPLSALLAPPGVDPGMVAGQEDVRNLPAAVLRGPCVVRVLGSAVELGGEGLVDDALRRFRVLPGSRRTIASRSTIAGSSPPERTYGPIETESRREMLDDALVESFEASGEQRQVRPRRQAPPPAPGRAGGPGARAR